MKAYRAVWLVLCGGLATAGAGMALTLSIPWMLLLFGCVATLVGAATIGSTVRRAREQVLTPNVMWFVVCRSVAAGAASVTVAGLGALVGAWVIPLVMLAVAGSPYVIHVCRRWARSLDDERRAPARRGPSTHEYPPRIAREDVRDLDLRSLSDTALCHAWRASFSALQETCSLSQRMRIVEARQQYLDELERRSPRGLMAWLASGARAAGNPSRFVIGGEGVRPGHIDWDGLIPRQD